MPELYDITHWNPQPWYSTGGTRAKRYVQSPEGTYYYFKRSQFKPGKDYKYEFWSEIIAYEVGRYLKFNVLRYDIAIDGDIMGCLCETMIDPDKEDLIEGLRYLQAYDDTFDPANTALRKQYTFQLIEKSLQFFSLGKFIDQIVEIIVFDSIIGNSDRHQENWAFIDEYSDIKELVEAMSEPGDVWEAWRFSYQNPKVMAPIYDNGSSLGRELSEERVKQLLQDEQQLRKYIEKGTSEIHWNNQKLGHFELIRELLKTPYREIVMEIGKRVACDIKETNISLIVSEIDNLVPETHAHYKLPNDRKQLIVDIISLRIGKLQELLNAGV